MNKPVKWWDYLTVNIYWLGLTSLSQTMTPLVMPLLVQQFVGEALKGTYYGRLRLWQLMTALLVQAIMGMLSDYSTSRFGRRRPFILLGTLGDILIIAMIGLSAGMTGMNGYWFLFAMVILLMMTTNTAHGALQGLIPDLAPKESYGRFSAVKAILEIPIPIILVGFTIGKLIKNGNLWGGLITLMVILLVTAGVTMLVREKPHQAMAKIDWQPIIRLGLMTAAFTSIIILMGKLVPWMAGWADKFGSAAYLWIMGSVGLAAMLFAIFIGVYASIQLGLGKETAQQPNFTWWVINRLAFLVGTTNLVSFIVYFLQGRLGYQGAEAAGPASNLTIFVGAFILISALPAGWLTDRFGRKKLASVSAMIAAIGTALIITIPHLAWINIGGCLVGMASGLFYTSNWALGTEIVPREQAGKFLGISNLAGAGAGAVGAYIGGPLADIVSAKLPGTGATGYMLLFTIYGVLFLVSIIALMRIRLKPTV